MELVIQHIRTAATTKNMKFKNTKLFLSGVKLSIHDR